MRTVFFIGMAVFAVVFAAMFARLPQEWQPWVFVAMFLGLPAGGLVTAWHRQDVTRDIAQAQSGGQRKSRASRRRRMTPSRATELRVIDHEGTAGEGRFVVGRGRAT